MAVVSSQTLIVMPTYCEKDSLPVTVSKIQAQKLGVHLLIVDDDSPDGTGEIADGLAAEDTSIHVLHRTSKDGLGAAYIAGFRWALQRDYDVVVEMDADGSHRPEDLPRLLDAIRAGADVVLGSRWVPGGRIVNWPMHRAWLSKGGNMYVRAVLGIGLRDATGGFRASRREVLQALDLDSIASQGYCFQVDMAWRARRAGFAIAEVPITFVEREQGVSKMSGDIVSEALLRTTGWGIQHRLRQLRDLFGSDKASVGAR